MTLVKFESDNLLVDKLKKFTGEAVASKAFLKAAEQSLLLDKQLKKLEQKHDRLFAAFQQQSAKIDGAREAAKLLLEKTSQKGIFDYE